MCKEAEINQKLISSIKLLRDDKGHKNNFGHVLICAGSETMTGALIMAVEAALRSGAGLVKAMAPSDALSPLRCSEPCAMTFPVDIDVNNQFDLTSFMKSLKEITAWADSVLIGPGIDSKNPLYKIILEYFIENASSLVIDASALDFFASDFAFFSRKLNSRRDNLLNPVIMTPHIGEFRRLIKDFECSGDELEQKARSFASDNNCILVLKSCKTVVSLPDGERYILDINNSGMAKGGSGDVLAGLLTGLCAQLDKNSDAALASVYLHSTAGIVAAERLGKRFMLPTDVVKYLGDAYKTVNWF
ncbi:MAG: NAD(P)H-hydrate dehydratase [Clostridia bacterium]|nr:NAD(P)H-hydrate dehydratase [Clostridia bacterium]